MTSIEPALIWMPTLLLVTARVAGVMLAAPVLGHSVVPVKVRVLVAVGIGLAAVGRLADPVRLPPHWPDLAVGLGCELLLGFAIGYAARLIFAGVELGAFHVAQQMGLSLAQVANPLAADAPSSVRGLLRLLAVVVFLAVGGHRALIGGLMQTFRTVPPLGFVPAAGMTNTIAAMLGASFVLALKVAAPVLIALLLATVALGLLHRTMPQCNLLSVGLPTRAMLGLLVLAATLGVLAPLIDAAAGQIGLGVRALTQGAR